MSDPERRLAERFDMQMPVLIVPPHSGGSDDGRLLLTRDISSRGAFVQTRNPSDYQGKLLIEMCVRISSGRERERFVRVKTTGVVVREESTGMAVAFDESYTLKPLE
jgi:hypothetical protein